MVEVKEGGSRTKPTEFCQPGTVQAIPVFGEDPILVDIHAVLAKRDAYETLTAVAATGEKVSLVALRFEHTAGPVEAIVMPPAAGGASSRSVGLGSASTISARRAGPISSPHIPTRRTR